MTESGGKQNNGNGSLMRLAPVPVLFHNDITYGMKFARLQSYTTHNGDEAAECCALLCYLLINLINRQKESFKDVFNDLKNFNTKVSSVKALACSQNEKFNPKIHPLEFNRSDDDRIWDWKKETLNVSPQRFFTNKRYYGSYCMDALYLSFHYAYHSKSAHEAILRAVNAGGDSDTVAAITGQIVGVIYGLEPEINYLYRQGIVQWDDFCIATTSLKLFNLGK